MEAMRGDRPSITRLAAIGAVLLDAASKSGDETDHAFWLASILHDIAGGVSPNEAFGWDPKPGAETRHRETFEVLRKKALVAATIEKFALAVAGGSYSAAAMHAALLWGVAETSCRASMVSVAPSKGKLSHADGVALALDMVAGNGASGYRGVARDTAEGYYKELIASRVNT